MKKVLLVVCAIFLGSAGFMSGCKKESKNDNSAMLALLAVASASGSSTYGGTSPIGDFIEVTIDRLNKKVTHTNYTNSPVTVNGPFSYTAVSVSEAYGFSILNKAVINASGDYVLFSEFPGAAVVYQMFTSAGAASGWPVYVVTKSAATVDNYYGRVYNWMKFYIDQSSTDSDMECGFAAFDTDTYGTMYGAGYSNRKEAEGATAISTINTGNVVTIAGFTWSDTMKAFLKYDSEYPNDMNYALSLSGTPSGTAVLDFGPLKHQGGALAIPQAASKAFGSSYAGTYFAIGYTYDKGGATRSVGPIKVVFANTGTISVFNYTDHTSTAMPFFTASMTSIDDFANGPGGTPVKTQFNTASGNSAATSAIVQNAHLCHGSFVAADGNFVLLIIFDPSGRFCSYTMFDNKGGAPATDDVIRFGFAIKDAGYTNSY